MTEGIRRQGGPTIATTQLWELRYGVKTNPRIRHLEALSHFFGVPIRYFFADDDLGAALYTRLKLLHAMRDSQIERIALHASGLSPQVLRAIAETIERARQVEGLKDGGASPEDHAGGSANTGRVDPAEPAPPSEQLPTDRVTPAATFRISPDAARNCRRRRE